LSSKDPAEVAALVVRAIEDLKGQDIVRLDVRKLTDVMDYLVIATGTSSRHVKSIADNVVDALRKAGERPLGVEGADVGEWILVDFGSVVVHVMGAEPRRFYAIEKLWAEMPVTR
jgi:ribosome-associated protein